MYYATQKRSKKRIGNIPDRSPEIPVYQARIEGLEMILKEKDRSIERLENDLRKADIDKEDLKATYNNYFVQVQTLINQKAIGTGSTPKEERHKENIPEQKENTPEQKECTLSPEREACCQEDREYQRSYLFELWNFFCS